MSEVEKSIYQELLEAGALMDNWQSDLYVLKTPTTERILRGVDNVTTFRTIAGEVWYEVPFAYEPWWESRIKS